MDPQAVGCAGARIGSKSSPPVRWRSAAAIALGALAVSAVTWFVASRRPTPAAPDLQAVRTIIPVVADAIVGEDGTPALALSADGRRLVYTAAIKGTTGLYVRRLDRLDATRLPGTDGGTNPFFSADGTAVGFFAEGKLKTVSLDRRVRHASSCNDPRTWWQLETANTIVFAPSSDTPLFGVDPAGGRPNRSRRSTCTRASIRIAGRMYLPGGRAVLYTAGNSTDNNFSDAQVIVQSLVDPKERRVIVSGGRNARYAAGHLVYLSGSSLVAAPFDPNRAELTGDPLTIVDSLSMSRYVAAAQFAVSGDGSLIYLPPGGEARRRHSHRVSRTGAVTPIGATRGFLPECGSHPMAGVSRSA